MEAKVKPMLFDLFVPAVRMVSPMTRREVPAVRVVPPTDVSREVPAQEGRDRTKVTRQKDKQSTNERQTKDQRKTNEILANSKSLSHDRCAAKTLA